MKPALIFAIAAMPALAMANAWNPMETNDQARQRQSAENYQTYKNNNYQAPLGGYNRPLGDTE